MLSVATIVVMLVVAYAYAREGLFTAALMVVNVLAAGLICYNFWEPVAGMLDSMVEGGALDGFQDFLSIVVIFGVTLLLLKLATNYVVDTQLEFHPMLHQFGGAAVGLLVGYLVSGFLISAMETLPWHRNFTGFVVRATGEPPMRSVFPPDRVWLGLMRHAGAFGFARDDDNPNADSAYDRCPTFPP
jgi:hypothetical protein